MEAFSKDFPKIKGSYTRLQNGALYSKILAERSAGRFLADTIQFSDISTAYDFKKRGGYEQYQSPQYQFFPSQYLSDPAGYFFFSGVTFVGIAYNTNLVPAADAPKNWKDLLDPRWKNAISMKQSTSGTQFVEWFELKKLYGDDFWTRVRQAEAEGIRLRARRSSTGSSKGDDKICGLAEWAGYLLVKNKGAPVAFVTPPDGMPATPTLAGVVDKAPHPEAAACSSTGWPRRAARRVYQNNPYLYYPSLRKDAQPMGSIKLSEAEAAHADRRPRADRGNADLRQAMERHDGVGRAIAGDGRVRALAHTNTTTADTIARRRWRGGRHRRPGALSGLLPDPGVARRRRAGGSAAHCLWLRQLRAADELLADHSQHARRVARRRGHRARSSASPWPGS